jgi:hypothetical protein
MKQSAGRNILQKFKGIANILFVPLVARINISKKFPEYFIDQKLWSWKHTFTKTPGYSDITSAAVSLCNRLQTYSAIFFILLSCIYTATSMPEASVPVLIFQICMPVRCSINQTNLGRLLSRPDLIFYLYLMPRKICCVWPEPPYRRTPCR